MVAVAAACHRLRLWRGEAERTPVLRNRRRASPAPSQHWSRWPRPGEPAPEENAWAVTPTPVLPNHHEKLSGFDPEPRHALPRRGGGGVETRRRSQTPGKWIRGGTTDTRRQNSLFTLPEGRQFHHRAAFGTRAAVELVYGVQTHSRLSGLARWLRAFDSWRPAAGLPLRPMSRSVEVVTGRPARGCMTARAPTTADAAGVLLRCAGRPW
jgi:hypothetical protein